MQLVALLNEIHEEVILEFKPFGLERDLLNRGPQERNKACFPPRSPEITSL